MKIVLGLIVVMAGLAGCAIAQTPAAPAPSAIVTRPRVRAALDKIRADNEWTLEQQVSICEIPAPPFGEAKRAEEFRRRLVALGLTDARIDRSEEHTSELQSLAYLVCRLL